MIASMTQGIRVHWLQIIRKWIDTEMYSHTSKKVYLTWLLLLASSIAKKLVSIINYGPFYNAAKNIDFLIDNY